jgi:hypothetical protein
MIIVALLLSLDEVFKVLNQQIQALGSQDKIIRE